LPLTICCAAPLYLAKTNSMILCLASARLFVVFLNGLGSLMQLMHQQSHSDMTFPRLSETIITKELYICLFADAGCIRARIDTIRLCKYLNTGCDVTKDAKASGPKANQQKIEGMRLHSKKSASPQ
jgi:hypothetical protein